MRGEDFTKRSTQVELMDFESISFEEFHQFLQDLERINVCTFSYRPTISWLNKIRRRANFPQSLSLLDIGSGHGDMLRQILKWAKKYNISVSLTGVDISPWSTQSAQKSTPPTTGIHFETADIFAFDPERKVDVVISSLFTHHLTDQELIKFILWMEDHATYGWFVNDLHRHFLPYFFIKYMVRLLRFNRLIQHDAPLSVLRSFTKTDWKYFLSEANISLKEADIKWYMPFRFGISREKPCLSKIKRDSSE